MNLDELISQEEHHLKNNQPDLEYQFSLIDGELAQIYSMHHKMRVKCGLLLMTQIEQQIMKEAVYQAEQRND